VVLPPTPRQWSAAGPRPAPAAGSLQDRGPGDPPKRAFKFAPGQIDPKWRNLDDVEIVVLQYWSEARLRIESIDPATSIVRFTGDTFRPANWSMGWYVETCATA